GGLGGRAPRGRLTPSPLPPPAGRARAPASAARRRAFDRRRRVGWARPKPPRPARPARKEKALPSVNVHGTMRNYGFATFRLLAQLQLVLLGVLLLAVALRRSPSPGPGSAAEFIEGVGRRGGSVCLMSFAHHDLRRVHLNGVTLNRLDLRGVDLRDADLRAAAFWGCDLGGARLAGADLRGAAYDRCTRWPAGFDPQAHGANLKDDQTETCLPEL